MACAEYRAPVDYVWEAGSKRIRGGRRRRASTCRRPGGESSAGSSDSPAPQQLSQQRHNRAKAERNNAAFEQQAPRAPQQLYDRVRKRAPRLPHGGTVAQLSAHEEQFWTRLARPARLEQKAADAEMRGLESSTLRPGSAHAAVTSHPIRSQATVPLRPRSSSTNPHAPKKTRRTRREVGVGDLAQIQMALYASTLPYSRPFTYADDSDRNPSAKALGRPAFEPQSSLSARNLSTGSGYRYRRDGHGFMVHCARGAYNVVSKNPDPVRRSTYCAAVSEFALVKQQDGQARYRHLARHPRTFPPGMPGDFEHWQWLCAIYIQKITRGYLCRAQLNTRVTGPLQELELGEHTLASKLDSIKPEPDPKTEAAESETCATGHDAPKAAPAPEVTKPAAESDVVETGRQEQDAVAQPGAEAIDAEAGAAAPEPETEAVDAEPERDVTETEPQIEVEPQLEAGHNAAAPVNQPGVVETGAESEVTKPAAESDVVETGRQEQDAVAQPGAEAVDGKAGAAVPEPETEPVDAEAGAAAPEPETEAVDAEPERDVTETEPQIEVEPQLEAGHNAAAPVTQPGGGVEPLPVEARLWPARVHNLYVNDAERCSGCKRCVRSARCEPP